ncbi:WD repeat-containing protein 87 [Thoreauomyces humboldtii]|nr:WD repeat-containing protein 87 [Thoreauomyces humboldtii]
MPKQYDDPLEPTSSEHSRLDIPASLASQSNAGSISLSSLGLSTASLDSDVSDDLPPSEALILPWRHILKKVRARASSSHHAATASVLPTTIPHGFQISRNLPHPRPTLRSAIYIPGIQDRIASVDSHFVHLWRNSTKVSSTPLASNAKGPRPAISGMCQWVFCADLKVLFIATAHLEIKVGEPIAQTCNVVLGANLNSGQPLRQLLSPTFEELTLVSSPKPVLSLEFLEEASELVAGGAGNIRIWKIKRSPDLACPLRFDGCRLTIEDLHDEDWVSQTIYSAQADQLFAAVGNDVYIYDYQTGERVETIREAHELSITAMLIFEPFGYLITASRDSTIKIFNRQNNLIHRLHDHTHAVTGLAIIPPPEGNKQSGNKSLAALSATPFFLSCSLDGTTPNECLGVEWMKGDTFMHWAKDHITVWSLNRFFSTFTHTRSAITTLQRLEIPGYPARVLAAAEDGSLRIVSPVTGVVLTIGFPVMNDMITRAALYDITQNRAWLLLDNGDLAAYSTATNPCEIVAETTHTPGRARICCMAPLSPVPPAPYPFSTARPPPTVYGLWGGCDAGQIVLVDVRDAARQEIVMQGHAGEIVSILWDACNQRLFTSGMDRVIKVWTIAFPTASALNVSVDPTADALVVWTALSAPATVTLTLVCCISVPYGYATHMSWCQSKSILALATNEFRLCTVPLGADGVASGTPKSHSRDDDHTRSVTDLTACSGTGIIASGSTDGTVKIWDASESHLLREIQFNYAVSSVTFANPRGDLLIGLPEEIVLVRVQDYLPPALLRVLLDKQPWIDDVVEDPTTFDSGLDFWGLYRGGEDKDGVPWHVGRKEVEEDQSDVERNMEDVERRLGEHVEAQEHHNHLLQVEMSTTAQFRPAPVTMPATPLEAGGTSRRVSRDLSYFRHASFATTFVEVWQESIDRRNSYLMEQERKNASMIKDVHDWGDGRPKMLFNKPKAAPLVQAPPKHPRDALTDFKEATTETRRGSLSSRHEDGASTSKVTKPLRPRRKINDGEMATLVDEDEEAGQDNSADDVSSLSKVKVSRPRAPSARDSKKLPPKPQVAKAAEVRPRGKTEKPGKANVDKSDAAESEKAAKAARQTVIRKGMERLGILPNSMVAGQTPSVLSLKKMEEDRERKDKDKTMLANARALVERRRAAERLARGPESEALEVVAEEPPPPADKTQEDVAGARRLRREISDRQEKYKLEMDSLPASTVPDRIPEHGVPTTHPTSTSKLTGRHAPAPAPIEPPTDPLPETKKARAHRRASFEEHIITGNFRTLAPDSTGVVVEDHAGETRIVLSVIPARVKPIQVDPSPENNTKHSEKPAAHDHPQRAASPGLPRNRSGATDSGRSLTRVVFEKRGPTRESDPVRIAGATSKVTHARASVPHTLSLLSDPRLSHVQHPQVQSRTRLHEPSATNVGDVNIPLERLVPELGGILNAFWFPGLGVSAKTYLNVRWHGA